MRYYNTPIWPLMRYAKKSGQIGGDDDGWDHFADAIAGAFIDPEWTTLDKILAGPSPPKHFELWAEVTKHQNLRLYWNDRDPDWRGYYQSEIYWSSRPDNEVLFLREVPRLFYPMWDKKSPRAPLRPLLLQALALTFDYVVKQTVERIERAGSTVEVGIGFEIIGEGEQCVAQLFDMAERAEEMKAAAVIEARKFLRTFDVAPEILAEKVDEVQKLKGCVRGDMIAYRVNRLSKKRRVTAGEAEKLARALELTGYIGLDPPPPSPMEAP